MTKFFGVLVVILLSLLTLDYFYFQNRQTKNYPLSEVMDYELSKKTILDQNTTKKAEVTQKIVKQKQPLQKSNKPRLMIIMDDIATFDEAKKLKKLGFLVVPSIFPKTKDHPNTPKIAKMFKSIMIHLPLEANSFPKPEINTILTADTKEVVKNKLNKALKDFKNIVAINNHTGSKFTSDKKALKYLISLIEKRSYIFIDSKTSHKSKYVEIQRQKGRKIFHRDIFLDNIQKISYIKTQIKKAVALAKKKGFAIAICHPHPATFKALQKSKKLLKKVRLVDIDEIRYKRVKNTTKTTSRVKRGAI